MGLRPPFETFKYATCRGCYSLGTACGHCERCAWERERMALARESDWRDRMQAIFARPEHRKGITTPWT